jgi:hypothetical protein
MIAMTLDRASEINIAHVILNLSLEEARREDSILPALRRA